MIKWERLLKQIPSSVQVASKDTFEIVWTSEFPDPKVVGEMRLHAKQIVILVELTPKEAVHTYIHELIHAVSDTYGAGLTEAQVGILEKALYFVLKPNNVFKE